ncbi:hypothetical protein [Oceanirhabdus sp. W0125-5]|uniref:hypothetical protein n=1 Tax=Oceanirhabdus sp. W0125-5 TaxID=2999116 RepID=UPI0022F2A517|nr:hypothetical protein [Oceanirhabdus sp. W0125-5]WBW97098.1 hypothetical protein OW730_25920 [Oceanirhabdus sp. W0125-5]
MRNKAFIAAVLTLGLGLGTIGISTQEKDIKGNNKYSKIYNLINDVKRNNIEQDNEDDFQDDYEVIPFDEFIGEDIKYLNKEEIKKLKELYDTVVEYEIQASKARDEFEDLLEELSETKGIELDNQDEESCGESCGIDYDETQGTEEGQDFIVNILEEIKDQIDSDLYEKILALYEKGVQAENENNYEEADKVWNQIDEILKENGINLDEFIGEGENEEIYAAFNVVNGKIEIIKDSNIKKPSLSDMKKYDLLWERVKRLVPKSYLNRISKFNINTDGEGGVLAYVYGVDDNGEKWSMSIDKKDAINEDGKLDNSELNNTIIHEFAHILTLNNSQMKKEINNESKTYTTDEGTTTEKAYLNKFYNKFWKNIYNEWQKAQESEDAREAFYDKYEEQFVSDYAPTNPEEDIAESFTHFVTQDKPKGNSVKEKKMLFFYEFDEAVKLRNEIRENLKKISALK